MTDPAHEATEKLLKNLEKRITAEYTQAYKEVRRKFLDYMRRFRIKDDIKRKAYLAGVITKDEYVRWRTGQILVGKRWAEMVNELAADLHGSNETARRLAQDTQMSVFAENHNFGVFVAEQTANVDLSYTLYSHDTVERLIAEDPQLLPGMNPKGKTAQRIAEGKDIAWNMQKVTSALTQGILQGESIPDVAKRLRSVAQMDHNASIRNARTMVTGAQNAGRLRAEAYAKSKGVDVSNVWSATYDMRTRHEHRVLHGQRRDPGEPFEVDGYKIMYPGDPSAAPHLVYNCRCSLIPQVKGFEWDIAADPNADLSQIDGMTYDQWKKSKVEKPNPITLPEQKAAANKGAYINEYKQLKQKTLAKSGESGIINSGGASGAKKTIGWEDRHAGLEYEAIRHRKNDAKRIAKHTNFSEKAIEEIRQHMFIKEHRFADGSVKRFDPSYEQVQAWDRLAQGKGTDIDIILLKHEYVELTQMRLHNYVYEEAHRIANKKHNWWKVVNERK